jgi:hypothetical protein
VALSGIRSIGGVRRTTREEMAPGPPARWLS